MMNSIPSRCPCCNVPLVARICRRHGGRFEACSNFDKTGCKVTWSHSNRSFNGLPEVIAPKTKTHGRVVSLREQTIARLVAVKSLTRDEAIEFLDAFGLLEVQRLLAA